MPARHLIEGDGSTAAGAHALAVADLGRGGLRDGDGILSPAQIRPMCPRRPYLALPLHSAGRVPNQRSDDLTVL